MRNVILMALVGAVAACSPVDRPKLKRDLDPIPTSAAPPAPAVSERLPQATTLPASVPKPPLPEGELGNAVADASVTVEVKTALGRDHELQSVELDTVNGHVVLRGEVGSVQARERAVWVASHVAGVRTVHDDLRVDRRTYFR